MGELLVSGRIGTREKPTTQQLFAEGSSEHKGINNKKRGANEWKKHPLRSYPKPKMNDNIP